MAASDTVVLVEAPPGDLVTTVPAVVLVPLDFAPVESIRRGPMLGAGIPMLVLGVAAVVGGAVGIGVTDSWVRVGMCVAGVTVGYLGIDRISKGCFGPRCDTGLWLSGVWLGVVTLAAAFADLLPLSEHENIADTLYTPTLMRPDLFSAHPLGTDSQGLDVLGGVIYGARVSLIVGFGATLLGMVVGSAIGLVAGYFRGKTDGIVGLLSDALLAFPPLIFLLAMVTVLDPSIQNTLIALGVLMVPSYIRLTRANTLRFAQREFVLAARGMGAKHRRIIVRELFPNVMLSVVSYGVIVIGGLIVAEASLSFLGLGIQRPTPTWGNMIAAGEDSFDRDPHVVFIPATCLFLTVYALNRVGEYVSKLLDPRQSHL